MIGKKMVGLMTAVVVFFVLTAPVAAAEKTIELTIPGCNA